VLGAPLITWALPRHPVVETRANGK